MKTNMKTEYVGSEGVEFRVIVPDDKTARYDEIVASANDEGTIQAWDARDLFSDPRNHTTMSLAHALRVAGFEIEATDGGAR